MAKVNKYLQELNEVSFGLLDAGLFCDTHPCDQDAIAFCHACAKKRAEALEEYNKNVGPMLMDQVDGCTDWRWIDGPWPWEGGNC